MSKTKTHPFPGSVFITEPQSNKTTFPQPLSMPIFMNKRIQVRRNFNPQRRYMEKHKKLYECPEVFGDECKPGQQNQSSSVLDLEKCPKILPKLGRTNFEGASWKLSPNRYKVKEVTCSRIPMGGAYWSRLERTDKTLPGRFAAPKFIGQPKFYDSTPGWRTSCSKYKGIFLSSARNRKPSSRLMVNDTVLCWKDKSLPGPAHYYPCTHTMKYQNSLLKKTPKTIVFRFLPNSTVAEPEFDFHKNSLINFDFPGPGRFDPLEIACSCQPNKLLDISILKKINEQNRRRYRRLSYKKIKPQLYCDLPRIRNIKGHGHTYIFKSKLTRSSLPTKETVMKPEKTEKLFSTANYISMINNPKRKPLFHRSRVEDKPRTIRFNCVYKNMLRKKLKENKKIAFSSGTPRFPGDDVVKVSKEPKRKLKEKKDGKSAEEDEEDSPTLKASKKRKKKKKLDFSLEKSTVVFMTQAQEINLCDRLGRLPERLRVHKRIEHESIFAFSPLPPPRVLLRDDEIGRFDSSELNTNIKEISPENYFQDEFCEHFVVRIKKDSLGQRPIDIMSVVD